MFSLFIKKKGLNKMKEIVIRNMLYAISLLIVPLFLGLIPIILFLLIIGCTIYHFFLEESQSPIFTKYLGKSEQMLEEDSRYDVDSDQKVKDFIFHRLKSPLTIIGLAIVVFFVIVAIFPQILTPLTFEQATGIYPGAWDPPSETHPLGQTIFGRDVLALLAYGVSTSIIVSILPVLIGIAIGLLFGYLSKVHRWVIGLVLGFMTILVILLFLGILGTNISVIMSIMVMYTIPGVILLISKGNYSLKLTTKKLIAYFPLFMGFNILLFEAMGFIGLSDPLLIQLGSNIRTASLYLYTAPWAFIWPGLALYVLVIGFFTLHYGLKEPIPIVIRISSKF